VERVPYVFFFQISFFHNIYNQSTSAEGMEVIQLERLVQWCCGSTSGFSWSVEAKLKSLK